MFLLLHKIIIEFVSVSGHVIGILHQVVTGFEELGLGLCSSSYHKW